MTEFEKEWYKVEVILSDESFDQFFCQYPFLGLVDMVFKEGLELKKYTIKKEKNYEMLKILNGK